MPVLAQSASSSTADSRPKPSVTTARRLPSASPAGPADPLPPANPANHTSSYLAGIGAFIPAFRRRHNSSSTLMPSPPPAADPPAAGPSTASTPVNAAAPTSRAGPSTSTAANAAATPAGAAPSSHATGTPASDNDVIDLTTSSPPRRHRHLVPAVRASGLAFPGVPGPSNAGASTSAAGAVAGPSTARRAPRRAARRSVMYISDDDDPTDADYRPQRTAADTEDDSDIEIVSERAAEPVLGRIHSPPPYIVPPNATATTSVAGRGRLAQPPQPRRSTRVAQAGSHADADDADASAARRLAAEYAAEGGVPGDYLAAQARAMDQARAGGGTGLAGRGFGGIFSPGLGGGGGGGGGGIDPFRGMLNLNREGLMALLGGGFWGGAGQFGLGGGGPFGLPPAAHVNGGWGGAAKVRAASKKYGVRMSHPRPVEKGFSRDIIEPRDPDTAEPPAKRVKGKGKAKAPPEEVQPVCASCLDPLLLGGEGDKKVFALRCGHVVCAKCLGEAKARCQEIKEREKGGWVMDVDEGVGRGGSGGKGKAREPLLLSDDDDDDDDLYGDGDDDDFHLSDDLPPTRSSKSTSKRASKKDKGKGKAAIAPPSSKLKGKGKSRADETGIEELWTTCPVSTCDGHGTDLLATEGWSKAYELFA